MTLRLITGGLQHTGCSASEDGGGSKDRLRGWVLTLVGAAGRTYHFGMTKAAKNVPADALRLGPDERAELAVEILASLDGPEDPDAEASWEREIQRRVAAIDAGTMKLEPWEDVKSRIEKEILGR